MTGPADHPAADGLRALLGGASGRLKVFPLPDVVLFPGAPGPFHIFEPRYRAMVADALAGDRLMAVATLRSAEGAAQERGAVYPVAGAGIIEAEERLDDGRFNVLVRGLARVRLAEELLHTGKPYREFRVEVLDDVWPPGGPAALAPDVDVLVRCVLELARRTTADDGVRDLAEAVARMRVPSRLADAVAAALVSETAERLALLEEPDVARRLARVTGDVAALLAAAPGRGIAGPSA